jgi:hypothetical protein
VGSSPTIDCNATGMVDPNPRTCIPFQQNGSHRKPHEPIDHLNTIIFFCLFVLFDRNNDNPSATGVSITNSN